MGIVSSYTDKGKDVLYLLFRLVFGGLFFVHGLMKFGFLGGMSFELASMMGVAGVLEVLIGAALVLGLFSRLAGVIGVVEMLVAYFTVHFPQGVNPLQNGGELALLYFAAFLVVIIVGNGTWNVEKALLKKEMF